ncbi:hypothetical protein [Edaphobacter aggregans]|uniref:hypothetical protein n=1 Tax=Edaphobacter aggregans TaxID=570835 RepID=UPI000689EE1A|nr:hypothetical protein [Edaphobacter aggregans]
MLLMAGQHPEHDVISKQHAFSMSSFSNPLTVPEDRPLDPAILHILTVVDGVAAKQGCPYIVVGVTARDLLLYHVFGIPAMRATQDVDFAIAVENWEQFQKLRTALLATDHFEPSRIEHRLFLKTLKGTTKIPIDLIPFGGVAEGDTIAWPPDRDTVMTVAGFEDALANFRHFPWTNCSPVHYTPRIISLSISLSCGNATWPLRNPMQAFCQKRAF